MTQARTRDDSPATVSSPDGRLSGVAVADELLDIAFPGDPRLPDYTAEGLAEQAASLLRAVMAERRERTRRVLARSGLIIEDRPHWDARQRRYRAALDEVEARGRSRGDVVKVTILGDHRDYLVRVHPRLLADPEPAEVLAELHSAYGMAVLDLRRQRAELVREHLPR